MRPRRWRPPRAFLARELGMTDMVAGPSGPPAPAPARSASATSTAKAAGCCPRPAPLRWWSGSSACPPAGGSWALNGRSIQITSPARLQRISSPLAVRGSAPDVYEGTLYFKVTQDRPGRDLLLGQGFVDGSASTQLGDLGQLRFRQPASTAPAG